MQRANGFSLIEVLLSVGIISILAGLSLPVYMSFQNRNDLDIAATSLASALRRAQVYTRGGHGDSQWGVSVQSGQITLFKGSSYVSRDTSYDEINTMPTSITLSGDGEVVFTKLTGTPDSATSTTLTSINNDTRTVAINAKGMVSY